jgi:hypothetical protein
MLSCWRPASVIRAAANSIALLPATKRSGGCRRQPHIDQVRVSGMASIHRARNPDRMAVWDTIGTLPVSGIEIVRLFRLGYCCVMGRKAPR